MRLIACWLCLLMAVPVSVQANNFPKGIKYLGGPGFPDDDDITDSWDNSLNITANEITFGFRKNLFPSESFPADAVTRITYGQATTRRVGQWVALGVLLAPVALVGIFHKSRQHRVLVEWTDSEGRDRAMLMQVHKDHFVGVLNDLAFNTGQPIWADEEDREWLFDHGVRAELDQEGAQQDPDDQ